MEINNESIIIIIIKIYLLNIFAKLYQNLLKIHVKLGDV